MQIYALDAKEKIIPANQAKKKVIYFCPDCRRSLRLRGGLWKAKHFYHVSLSKNCRKRKKPKTHRKIQLFLKTKLGENVFCEYPFPAINRIADILWLQEKIVFEIQCSPISKKEVESRNKDYAKEGLQVVWILHDRTFNQARLSEAEIYLQNWPHYFTNMTFFGQGGFYDQLSLIRGGVRDIKSKKFFVDLTKPLSIENTVKERKQWPIFFDGDASTQVVSFTEKKEKRLKHRIFKTFEHFLLEKISSK